MIYEWLCVFDFYIFTTMKKDAVIKTLESFGDEVELEKLFERLLFIDKVDAGFKGIDEHKVLNFKEVKKKFFDKHNK
jgi:hypothetical protein